MVRIVKKVKKGRGCHSYFEKIRDKVSVSFWDALTYKLSKWKQASFSFGLQLIGETCETYNRFSKLRTEDDCGTELIQEI